MRRLLETEIVAWAQGDDSRPLLLQGARRTGKTYLLNKLGKQLFPDGFVRLDFQTDLARIEGIFAGATDDVASIVARIEEYKRVRLDPRTSLLVFDEVQLSEKALNSLRFFAQSPWKVAATGSLLGVSVKRRTLPFPAEVKHLRLYPMTFEEFLWAFGEDAMAQAIRGHAASGEPYVLHREASDLYRRYLTVGGMPKAVRTYRDTRSYEAVREVHEEIDITYTADMTDPDNGISAAAAKRIWNSLPGQLLRSSTRKFKYSDVMRGGRRSNLLEPLEWLEAAGIVLRNDLTCSTSAPLTPFETDGGAFFKEYIADCGLMFHKFGIEAEVFHDPALRPLLSADFRGALAENATMQALVASGLNTYYWMPSGKVGQGEVDFVFQDRLARVVPIEVKSGRNVRARSLARLIREGRAARAYVLSDADFSLVPAQGEGCEVLHAPLYAAFALAQAHTAAAS